MTKVLVPFELTNCESDCPFWEITDESNFMCNFDLIWRPITGAGIPEWCPLLKFKV